MVWRRVQVPSTMTLRKFHGVLQVAMGWDDIHLYQFVVHTVCYGSWELSAESANIVLGDLKLRKGSRFLYEYDLNIPWEHEIRLEDTPTRVSTRPDNYDDLADLVLRLVQGWPDRCLWGSDWPHVMTPPPVPRLAPMLDLLKRVLPQEGLRAVLQDNPAALYRF